MGRILVLFLLLALLADVRSNSDGLLIQVAIPVDCQVDGQKVLQNSRTNNMHPMLSIAIVKCLEELCDKDSYEWILLNVAGMFRNSAEESLNNLAAEHKENFKHKDELPPLAAEQQHIDGILASVQNARKYYNVALVCKGINSMLVTQKANELETLVFTKTSEIEVEVRSLRKRLQQPKQVLEIHPLVEEAECPNEILERHEKTFIAGET